MRDHLAPAGISWAARGDARDPRARRALQARDGLRRRAVQAHDLRRPADAAAAVRETYKQISFFLDCFAKFCFFRVRSRFTSEEPP